MNLFERSGYDGFIPGTSAAGGAGVHGGGRREILVERNMRGAFPQQPWSRSAINSVSDQAGGESLDRCAWAATRFLSGDLKNEIPACEGVWRI